MENMRDLFVVYTQLEQCLDQFEGEIAYDVVMNMEKMESHVKAIRAALKPSPEFEKYEEARLKICRSNAKTANDQPLIVDGNYVFEDEATVLAQLSALEKQHHAAIEDKKEKEKILDRPVKIKFNKVDSKLLKKTKATARAMRLVLQMNT